MKNKNFFWIVYSDLMSNLFFIMLILFVVSVGFLQFQKSEIESEKTDLKDQITVHKNEKKEMENIQTALKTLDSTYFSFDKENFRYKMLVDLNFDYNDDNIYSSAISDNERRQVKEAGRLLYDKMNSLIKENPEIFYFLIIEGNTQRTTNNWLTIPDAGYRLSYKRALALFNFWKDNGIDFRKLAPNCEIILAGSGYFGLSREKNEQLNRRFTIQITSKWKLEK